MVRFSSIAPGLNRRIGELKQSTESALVIDRKLELVTPTIHGTRESVKTGGSVNTLVRSQTVGLR
jgi:hypothetical protein